MHRGKQCPPNSQAFVIFSAETISCKCPRWDQQIPYNNAHLGLENVNKCPTFSGDKAKILPVKETVKPQIHEVNIMNAPVLTVTNTTQATTSERLMKINCILFIEYRWPECFHFETMLQRCPILQPVKMDVFFQIGSFFIYINLSCNLWNSNTFYSNSSQSFPNWAPHAAVFSPQ